MAGTDVEPVRYVTSPLLAEAAVPHLFTTRHFPGVTPARDSAPPFDVSAMALLAELGVAEQPPAYLRQVHGTDVVEASSGGLAGRADVLATGRARLPLAIFTADCVPVILYDPENGRLALAHAGWRGTASGVVGAAAGALVATGGRPECFVAAIGPSIGPCCYEVDAPVIERLDAAFPDLWKEWVEPVRPGKWMLDLWRANDDQLRAAGMLPERIDNLRLCTGCRPEMFFSHRRERGRGRLVAVAAVPDQLDGAC